MTHQVGVFPEQGMQSAGPGYIGDQTFGQADAEPGRQRCRPLAENPFALRQPVFPSGYKRGLYIQTALEPMLPVVPSL